MSDKTLFEEVKCLTRRYTIFSLIMLAIGINVLVFGVEYYLYHDSGSISVRHHQWILGGVTLFVSIIVIMFFLYRLDVIRDKMVHNLQKLLIAIRKQTPDTIGDKIDIPNVSCHDEVYEIVEALNKKSEQVSQYIQHLRHVIGYIQHEFNTPLATLSLGLERLPKQYPEAKDAIRPLIDEIEGLSYMVTNLSYLSTANKETIERDTLVAHDVIMRVVTHLEKTYGTLSLLVSGDKDMTVMSHDMYLYLILKNIIENAVKYSEKDATITILLGSGSISVIDTGKGMSHDDVGKMWLPFWQADTSRGKDAGLGLGLSLVHELSQLLDIHLDVQSELGVGTTITLYFSDI